MPLKASLSIMKLRFAISLTAYMTDIIFYRYVLSVI